MAYVYLPYPNLFQRAGTILSASSTDPAFPVGWLRDQSPSKTWRSKSGYNVVAGFNDKLDFTEAGVARVATLTAANYATPALYAAQLQLAMNAAPGAVNTYVVTYDASVHKFTIARNAGAAALVLKFLTGANVATSAHIDIGFGGADWSGFTTYLAGSASYHTREWIQVDLITPLAVSLGAIVNCNLAIAAASTLRLQGNATDVWTAPSENQLLTDNLVDGVGIGIKFFNSIALRFWRFLISDVENADGFSEVGIAFAGTGTHTTVGYSINLSNDPEELSAVDVAIQGAHWQDQRPIRKVWSLEWEEIGDADVAVLDAWAAGNPRGKNCFFMFDAVVSPLDTIYCYRASALRKQYIGPAPGGGYWTLSVQLAEVLG